MSLDTSQYQICGYEITPWSKIFPALSAGYTTTLIGIYLGKMNTFILTRLQFLQYLNFFSSYSDEYTILYNNYGECFTEVNNAINKYLSSDVTENAFSTIDEKFKYFVGQHYKDVKTKGGNNENLLKAYNFFFKNYRFFVRFKKGYNVKWTVKTDFFANISGAKYPVVNNTDTNYVEFSTKTSPKQEENLRFFPLIEIGASTLRLVVFSNNKFIKNIDMLTINSSTLTPSYQLSLNSIDSLSFPAIADLSKDKIEMKLTSVIKSFFHNGTLYPNPNKDEKQHGQLTLLRAASDTIMIGKNLFDDDFEIN